MQVDIHEDKLSIKSPGQTVYLEDDGDSRTLSSGMEAEWKGSRVIITQPPSGIRLELWSYYKQSWPTRI